MNRNAVFIIISALVSIVLHVLVFLTGLGMKLPEPPEKTDQFIRMIDAVMVEVPSPAVPEPPVPKPPEIIEQKSKAVIPIEKKEPEQEPQTEQKTESPFAATEGAFSPGAASENFLPFYRVDKRPEFIRKAELKYPLQAKRQKVEGTVILEADIDSSGIVRMIKIVKSAGFGFDEAAIEMINQSTFSPASTGGQNVGVRMRFTIKFEL